jgi:hypothetical protein
MGSVVDFARWDRRAQLFSSCQPVGCDSITPELKLKIQKYQTEEPSEFVID